MCLKRTAKNKGALLSLIDRTSSLPHDVNTIKLPQTYPTKFLPNSSTCPAPEQTPRSSHSCRTDSFIRVYRFAASLVILLPGQHSFVLPFRDTAEQTRTVDASFMKYVGKFGPPAETANNVTTRLGRVNMFNLWKSIIRTCGRRATQLTSPGEPSPRPRIFPLVLIINSARTPLSAPQFFRWIMENVWGVSDAATFFAFCEIGNGQEVYIRYVQIIWSWIVCLKRYMIYAD